MPRDFDGSANGGVADNADLAPERLWKRCVLNSGTMSIAPFS